MQPCDSEDPEAEQNPVSPVVRLGVPGLRGAQREAPWGLTDPSCCIFLQSFFVKFQLFHLQNET